MAQAAQEKENFFSAHKLLASLREGEDPAWLSTLRAKAGEAFEALEFPTTRNEAWKYTNLAPIWRVPFRQVFDLSIEGLTPSSLAPHFFEESQGSRLVFVNGLFARELSDVSKLPGAVTVRGFHELPADSQGVFRQHLAAHAGYRDEVFTALNTASLTDGAFVHIPAGRAIEAPIHVLFLSTAAEPTVSHPRVLLVAEEGAIATLIESYAALGHEVYFNNAVTEVVAARGAVLSHYRLQDESERAFHIGRTQVVQERDSHYTSYSIALGGELARHTLEVSLTDERIETTIDGLYVGTGRQHIDNHTTIDHAHPHCASHQLYKGILDGQARAVFNGKVVVREGALLTDARQLNKNLLLSREAHIDTKPELEIFADDVKCAHGATVGQLEEEELFYLASRGLPAEQARALLTYGFAEDVIGKIRHASVRERLDQRVLEKLHQSLEVR